MNVTCCILKGAKKYIFIRTEIRYNSYNVSSPNAVFGKWRCICRDAVDKEGSELKNMCEWIDRIEEKGIMQGMEKGIKKERMDAIARMMSVGLTKDQILSCGYTQEEMEEAESILYANA